MRFIDLLLLSSSIFCDYSKFDWGCHRTLLMHSNKDALEIEQIKLFDFRQNWTHQFQSQIIFCFFARVWTEPFSANIPKFCFDAIITGHDLMFLFFNNSHGWKFHSLLVFILSDRKVNTPHTGKKQTLRINNINSNGIYVYWMFTLTQFHNKRNTSIVLIKKRFSTRKVQNQSPKLKKNIM